MTAELTLRFAGMGMEDKHLLCVVLSNQCQKKTSKDIIKQLSEEGTNWLIDYETQLLEAN